MNPELPGGISAVRRVDYARWFRDTITNLLKRNHLLLMSANPNPPYSCHISPGVISMIRSSCEGTFPESPEYCAQVETNLKDAAVQVQKKASCGDCILRETFWLARAVITVLVLMRMAWLVFESIKKRIIRYKRKVATTLKATKRYEVKADGFEDENVYSTALDKLEQELQCPMCRDWLSSPVLLPCGHKYCKECWKGHVENSKQLVDAIVADPQIRSKLSYHARCPLDSECYLVIWSLLTGDREVEKTAGQVDDRSSNAIVEIVKEMRKTASSEKGEKN